MTEKQNDLDRRVTFALDFLSNSIDHEKNEDVRKFLTSAKTAFEELHEDWRVMLGSPKYLNSNTVAAVLEILAHIVRKYGLQLKQEGTEDIGVKWHDKTFYKWLEDLPPDVKYILKNNVMLEDI